MQVFGRGRLRAVRWAIGLGVLAASPFAMAGVAQANSGTAPGSNFTTVPNFRFVTINQATGQASFCFDGTLSNNGVGGSTLNTLANHFDLIGYRWNVAAVGMAASLSSSDQRCVVVTITTKPPPGNGVRNLSSYTLGSVKGGTVVLNAGGASPTGNVGDSAPNLGSQAFNSHAGTGGHDQGPGLLALVGGAAGVDVTDNALFLQFDQQIGTTAAQLGATCGRVMAYDTNGVGHFGVIIGGNSTGQAEAVFGQAAVTAGCPLPNTAGMSDGTGGTNFSVSQARRVVVYRTNTAGDEGRPANQGSPGAPTCIEEQGGDAQTCGPTFGIPIPGTSGATNRPDLVSAVVNPSSNTVDATFSVNVNAVSASDAVVVLSDGTEEVATGTPVVIGGANGLTGNVVRFTFSGGQTLQKFSEMAIGFSVYGIITGTGAPGSPCAVQDVNSPHNCNTTGGVPIGGNGGAFGTGFANGGDPMYLIVTKSSGLIRIGMDQRIDPATVTPADVNLFDNTGTFLSNLTGASVTVVDNGFLSELDITATPSTVSHMADLQLQGAPWHTSGVGGATAAFTYHGAQFGPQGNVESVMSPTAIAAKFRSFHRANRNALKRAIARTLHRKHRSHRR